MPTKKERSQLGRLLASLRRKVKVRCPVCGAEAAGTKKRVYCSVACRQAAYRERKHKGQGG